MQHLFSSLFGRRALLNCCEASASIIAKALAAYLPTCKLKIGPVFFLMPRKDSLAFIGTNLPQV